MFVETDKFFSGLVDEQLKNLQKVLIEIETIFSDIFVIQKSICNTKM